MNRDDLQFTMGNPMSIIKMALISSPQSSDLLN